MFFKPRFWLVLFAFLAFIMPVWAQDRFVFDGDRKQEALVFKKSRGLIILPLYINGKGPFNFILDTGVGHLLITDADLKDSLQLKYLRKMKIEGLGEQETLTAYSTSFLELRVGSATFKDASAAILTSDIFNLSGYLGMPIHGLIGYDFFKSFIVKINYEANILKIFSTGKARLYKKGTKFPLLVVDKKPFIDASVETDGGKKLWVRLLIDSGSGHPISLESYNNQPFDLPKRFVDANLGIGLSGNIRGFYGRINALNIGKFTLNNVLCSFPLFDDVGAKAEPDTRNGSIGNPLLSKFIVVFDYQKNRVFLKPLANFKKPFDYDKSGMEIVADGKNFDRYIVSRVESQSAASDFGILVGDEILTINFKKASTMSIGEIIKILSAEAGRTLFIEIVRGDEIIMGILKLKNRI
ncbi:MAG TPA: aspartyl protease family protein [Pelobium sp.]|nr:aspartyl protease family protein [Pelobium sp.]